MLRIYKFLFAVGLVVLAFLVPEMLARIFLPEWEPPVSDKPSLFVHNPHTGWTHPPSITMDHYGGSISSNSLGLRDREPGEKKKPRVVFLGDSFTWGWSIGDDRDRYTDRLQARFGEYQFINAGVIGFNTLQELLLLQHHANEIQPDYVVIQMFANDFRENVVPEGIYPRPYFDCQDGCAIRNYPSLDESYDAGRRAIVYLGENTYFYRQLLIRLYTLLLQAGISFEEETHIPGREEMTKGMKLALPNIYEFGEDHNIHVLVFFSGMESYQIEIIESISQQHGITAVNLDPAFIVTMNEWKDHTQHWTSYGHELVAAYLQPHLQSFLESRDE
jgi:hypothetical protein